MSSDRQAARQRCKELSNRPPEQAVTFDPEPETICYRGQTLAIVNHYFEISSQLGRLPSILGREFFRAKVSHQVVPSFEDQALFVHDVQQSLMKLQEEDLLILSLVGLYDLSHDDVAAMLHRSTGCISQRYGEALARLTQVFLDVGVLRRDNPDRRQTQMKGRKLPDSALPSKKPWASVTYGDTQRIRRVPCMNN